MPASNSEHNRDPGQDTDNPLPNREHANEVQPGHTAEHYVPWLGDRLEDFGLIPKFLIGFFAFFSALTSIFIFIWVFFSAAGITSLDMMMFLASEYIRIVLIALFNWSPLILGCIYLANSHQSNKSTLRIVIVIGACLFGLLSWAYCTLVSSGTDGNHSTVLLFRTWYGWTIPQSSRGCHARVEPKQVSLFETDIYYTQFARNMYVYANSTLNPSNLQFDPSHYNHTFDMERFRSIQVNQTLCGQGFEGNDGIYGLGIRISLYLQWLSSFLANNFLSATRQELQKAYLISSLAICLATIITSFIKACVFSIEIEIMYWMYWGGYICVFASTPCQLRLGSETRWIKLDWTTMILFTTHVLMIYQGAWFLWYAYDQVFARMPCGTYHFFLFPILDPSECFWTLRDYTSHLIVPFIPPLLATFPFVGLLLASEVKHTIQHSATYQTLFPKSTVSDRDQPRTIDYNASVKTSLGLRVYLFIAFRYRAFREFCYFPSHSREGIRLVTPIDIRDRRVYRIRWAAMGLLSYMVSIIAIEVILKWNKVSGIYSIASTSQFVALIIGVGSFVSVLWTLVLQEVERRRDLQRRQIANQDEDGIELDSLSHNLSEAMSHAFSRPDIGFFTNGGAFPITSGEEDEEAIRSLNNPRPSPNIEVFMSGALDVQPDLEAQTPATS